MVGENSKMKKTNGKSILQVIINLGKNTKNLIKVLQMFLSKMRVKRPKKKKILPWSSMIHLFLFSFVFFYYEVLLRVFNGKGVFNHLIYPLIFGMAAGLLMNVFTTMLNKKINRICSIVIMSGTAIYFITETLVKRTFQVYMTLPAILQGADGVAGNYTSEMVNTILGGLVVIIAFFLPIVLYYLLGKKLIPAHQYKWPVAVLNVILSLAVFVVGVLFSSFGPSKLAYKNQYEFNNATETFGLLTSTRLSMTRTTSSLTSVTGVNENNEWEGEDYSIYKKNEMDIDFASLEKKDNEQEQEIDSYMESAQSTSKNKFTGIFQGKNLIMICAEAFHGAVVSEELTPTLYRMIHNGFYFSDFYQPTWGGSTSTGEFSFLLGLVPTYGIETMLKVQTSNNYFTMGNQLQRLGYLTGSYHNGDYDYYDRNLTHENLGYNYFLAIGNGLEKITNDNTSDLEMFDKTLDTYLDQEPFCMYYMSLDGHSEYTLESTRASNNYEYVTSIIGTDHSDTVLAYYCYQYNFELALENLVQRLEEAGIMDDTVICICPDHYPYGLAEGAYNNEKDYFAELIGQEDTSKLTQDKNSMVIWSTCLEEGGDLAPYQCEISSPTYSLDILPTLSNLFGLEYDSRMMVGRDVFSDAAAMVVWTDYSWVSSKGFYDASTGEFYPNEGEEEPNQSYIDTMCSLAQNKVNLSKQIVDTDYYKHVFGKDDITDSTKVDLDPTIAKIIEKRKEQEE